MIGEIDVYGVFFPALLGFAIVAALLQHLLQRALEAAGVYRFIWHRPLFDLALFIILLGTVMETAQPVLAAVRYLLGWMAKS